MSALTRSAVVLAATFVATLGSAEARARRAAHELPRPDAAYNQRGTFMSRGGTPAAQPDLGPGVLRWNTPNADGNLGSSSTGGGKGGGP